MKNSASDAHASPRSAAPPPSPPDSNARSSAPGATSNAVSSTAASPASSPAPRRLSSRKAPVKTDGNAAKSGAATKSGSATKSGDEAKKRVRLKPETREQLLERLRNPPLSLHETSILLRVSRATVRRYADAGRLPCLRTPGGQRRFALRDIETFYRQLKTKR